MNKNLCFSCKQNLDIYKETQDQKLVKTKISIMNQ